MAYWDKKSNAYYASVTLNEKRKRIKLPGVTRQREADEIESKLRLQIITGEYQNQRNNKPAKMADELARLYIDNYSRVNNRGWVQDNQVLDRFFKTIGIKKADEYTTLDIEKYKRIRLQTVKPVTINRELTTISSFFNRMVEWKELSDHEIKFRDFAIPDDELNRNRIPTKKELQLIFASIKDPEYFLIIETLCFTGLRRSDVADLKVDNIKFEDGVIQFRQSLSQSKTGRRVTIILHPQLQQHLSLWIQTNNIKEGKIFSISSRQISESFKTICLLLGIKDLRLHDLRHTYATALSMTKVDGQSIDPFALSSLLGHKSIDKTLIYVNPIDEYKKSFVDNMDISYIENDPFQSL